MDWVFSLYIFGSQGNVKYFTALETWIRRMLKWWALSLSTWLNPKYKFIPEIMQLHRYWQFCLAEYLINIVAMPWIIRKSKWPIFDCHFRCIVCIKLMNEPTNQPSTEWTKVQLISCCATVCNISVPNYNLIQFKSSSWIFSLSLSLGVQRSKITL